MKAKLLKIIILSQVIIFLCSLSPGPCQANAAFEKYFVAIEFNKVLCGYSEISLSDSVVDGKEIKVLEQEVHFDFSALGRDLSQYQKFTYHIDPVTGNFIYHDSYHKQEDMERGGFAIVEDRQVRFSSLDSANMEYCDLPEKVVLPNTQFYYHLKHDFVDLAVEEMVYQIYNVSTGKISEMSYLKTGEEKMKLAERNFDAITLTESDPTTGLKTMIWIDKKTGMRLRMESPSKIVMYLSDESVKTKIKKGNWDDVIFGKTNKSISTIRGITYMRVKVVLDAIPHTTFADLNYPGQKFTGNVDGSKVDGIFEISHSVYNGENAPSFPLDTMKFKNLTPWLLPADNIESEDSVLVNAALEITEGSNNLWDAAHRISLWVIKNVDGSLQNGTARETYDSRSGLCGSQSLLTAALCRAVGIPAKVVWGCMYTKEQGGSFGNHGWNEVFMGDAGWIPLDVTINESNYIDSGHFRLGELRAHLNIINYDTLEILDYKTR